METGSAIPTIVAGLFFGGVALLLLHVLVVLMRGKSSRRSLWTPVPAGADPGGARRTHHPDRGHHGSGGAAVHAVGEVGADDVSLQLFS
jgi:hypothetical protein